MKNKKRIIAVLASTALTLGVVTPIFADDTNLQVVYSKSSNVATSKDGTDATNLEVVSSGGSRVATSNQIETTTTAPAIYTDLKYTTKDFRSDTDVFLGSYPVFTDAKALNDKIDQDLTKLKDDFLGNYYRVDYDSDGNMRTYVEGYSMDDFSVSFTKPENNDQYAKVVITVQYDDGLLSTPKAKVNLTYYVDKQNMSIVSKDSYDAGIAAQKSTTDTDVDTIEEKSEIVLVPLRKVAQEKLGYNVEFDATTNVISVSSGKTTVTFKTGVNKYTVNGVEKTLEIEPTLTDGATYVPSSFFSTFFNVNLTVDSDNNIIIAQ